MKLAELIDRAQELADRKDTSWDSRCRVWVNEAIGQWARQVPWPSLRRIEDFTFNSRENTGRRLTLPQYADKVLRVADDTNNLVLRAGANPDLDFPNKHLDNTAGAALFYRELGIVAVHDQPSVAAVLSVRPTVSEVLTVYVGGTAQDTTASGTPDEFYQAHEEIATTGSDAVAGTTLFVRVDTLGKSVENTAGDILVTTAADGQISRIYSDDWQPRYRQLELIGAPTDGTVFQVEYLLKPPRLQTSNDFAPCAVDPDYIIWYTAAQIKRAQGDIQDAELLRQRADRILEREASFEKNAGDQDYRSYPEPLYWASEDQYTWSPDS